MDILVDNDDFIVKYDNKSHHIIVSAFLDHHFQSECIIEAKPIIHAHWIYSRYPTNWYGNGSPPNLMCSYCFERAHNYSSFCPECGSVMDGDIEET